MNVLSLFDGMSCGQIALERAGIKVDDYFASEIDKYAMQVTQKNYPNTKQIGSVIDVKDKHLPKIDLLIGGSPCQSFSRAGDGTGFNGKSGLFYEYVRLLKEVNPIYFLLENVIMKKEWEDVITKEMGVKPIRINSSVFTAQDRDRLYWTNIPVDKLPQSKNLIIKDVLENTSDYDEVIDSNMITKECGKYYQFDKNGKGYNSQQNRIRKLNKPSNCLSVGTASIPKIKLKEGDGKIYLRKLTPIECERLQGVPLDYTDNVSKAQRHKMIGNGWTVDVITHIFKNLK